MPTSRLRASISAAVNIDADGVMRIGDCLVRLSCYGHLIFGLPSYLIDFESMACRSVECIWMCQATNAMLTDDGKIVMICPNDGKLVSVFTKSSAYLIENNKRIHIRGEGAKKVRCKNRHLITGRWSQECRGVYRYIENTKYNRISLFYSTDLGKQNPRCSRQNINVEDFYVCDRFGKATLDRSGTLYLPYRRYIRGVNMRKVNKDAKWRIITRAANRWICSGDTESQTTIASISRDRKILSKIDIRLQDNTDERQGDLDEYNDRLAWNFCYEDEQEEFVSSKMEGHVNIDYGEAWLDLFMYCIKTVFERSGRAILLAAERIGCCHLISMARNGGLAVIQSIQLLVPADGDLSCDRTVMSVTETNTKGEFIVLGINKMQKVTIKLN